MQKTVSALCLLLCAVSTAFGFGGQHGKTPEPLTVIPLTLDGKHQLAINQGVVSDARAPIKAQLEIRVKRLDAKQTQLVFQNISDRPIQLALYVVHADGRFRASASCPLAPGQSSTEIWHEAFDAIGFGPAQLLGKDEVLSCN